ncbi:dihydroorotase [Parapedomonas caeni]
MTDSLDMILKNGTVVTPGGAQRVDVGVRAGRIVELGDLASASAGEVVDCTGLHVLPGVIDTQVHFREPGLEHKEDLATGSLAAVMGGVTAVFEMPNTKPSTTTAADIADKVARAKGRMWCDHAFYVGATADNIADLPEYERVPGCCGVKVFMGASTGDLLVWDDPTLEKVLAHGQRRVAIHCEDEERMRARKALALDGRPETHPVWRDDESALLATRRAVALARKTGRRVHILHVTTPAEMAFLRDHKDIATVETTPQHLTLGGPDCYERLGTFAQMNPPIRSAAHRDGLWHWVGQGVVDVIGSDHAPHTIEEKAKPYPQSPSGMPGVQTLLPLLLDHMAHGRLSLDRLVDLTSAGAARVWGLVGKGRIVAGYEADFTVVDLKKQWTVSEDWLASRAGWSPFTGMTLTGKAIGTIIRGQRVMWEDAVPGTPIGAPLRFHDTWAGGGARS